MNPGFHWNGFRIPKPQILLDSGFLYKRTIVEWCSQSSIYRSTMRRSIRSENGPVFCFKIVELNHLTFEETISLLSKSFQLWVNHFIRANLRNVSFFISVFTVEIWPSSTSLIRNSSFSVKNSVFLSVLYCSKTFYWHVLLLELSAFFNQFYASWTSLRERVCQLSPSLSLSPHTSRGHSSVEQVQGVCADNPDL